MRAEDVIESYVRDVIRRLPRRQRDDVGFELRALLQEELRGKAEEAGRAPDEAMAMELVHGFGAPQEVAARYQPPGFALIEPSLSPAFVYISSAGVVIQWVVSLSGLVSKAPNLDLLQVLGRWWPTAGLGAFWWPGFLLLCFALGGWTRRRWPALGLWRPSLPEHNRVNRLGMIAALLFFIFGAAALVFAPMWTAAQFGPRVAVAFAYAPDFYAVRGPFMLLLWIAQFVLLGALIVRGHWTPLLRRIEIWLNAAIYGVCAWYLAAGPIFVAKGTDGLVKFILIVIVFFGLIDIGIKLYRRQERIATPSLPASPSA